jgi:hypothetical protein
MSAVEFREALAAVGIDVGVEELGRVAVVTTQAPLPLDAARRRQVVALGRKHGFSNIALELAPDENLSGD